MTRSTADRRRTHADVASRVAACLVFASFGVVIVLSALSADEPMPATTTTLVEVSPEQPKAAVTTETTTSTVAPTTAGEPPVESTTTTEATAVEPVAGSSQTTTVTTQPGTDSSFWGQVWSSPAFVIGAQLLVAALAAFVVGGLVQRAWLGVFEIKLSAAGVELAGIPKAEIEKAQRDIVRATEVPVVIARRVVEGPVLEDERLVVLQKRIALELRVRALAASTDAASQGSLTGIVVQLQQQSAISPGLAAALLALFDIGDRIGRGAEIEPAALIQLLAISDDALARLAASP